MVLIPKTKARLQPYITIYAVKHIDYQQAGSLASASPELPENWGDPIGVVQTLEVTNSRPVNFYRELYTDSEGRIAETYPGLPTYELTLSRVVLYDSHILDAFKAVDDPTKPVEQQVDILHQIAPLAIRVDLPSPDGKNDKTWTFIGCWFQNNPISFDITADDTRIVQEATVTAAGVIASSTTSSGEQSE